MISKDRGQRRTVHFVSLGCPKNRVDTEAMLGLLEKQGYRHISDPAEAGVVVVNTCGFLGAAVGESLDELRRLASHKTRHGFRLVAAGCLAQRMGERLRRLVPGIDSVIGVHGCQEITEAVGKNICFIPPKPLHRCGSYYQGRRLTTGPGWAYLRIADGCDNRCSYCLIPSIRGRFRSRPLKQVVAEARLLVERGVKEINLVAQDTTNYGMDLYGQRCLGRLLKALERIEGLEWVRLLYTHPAHWDERLISDLSDCCKVVAYIDLPLQHCSDRILRSMGRSIERRGLERLITSLRTSLPGLTLRTTMMVGYPGETEAEFEDLVGFVCQQKFERLGAFVFSPEPGTRAAKMKGRISDREKEERRQRLMRVQRAISADHQQSRVGRTAEVLVEGECRQEAGGRYPRGYGYYGRSQGEAPEVDGRIFIRSRRPLEAGQKIFVKLTEAWDYDLGSEVQNGAVV